MAILLQTLSARLGIVDGRDLAQACRETYPRAVNLSLWLLCEIAIVACDLAEVLGAAIALNLLFHMPLLIGVLITALDTLLRAGAATAGHPASGSIHSFADRRDRGVLRHRNFLAKPDFGIVGRGLIPAINNRSLYLAIGMLGATVMPHNLYLHSALVQTRSIGKSEEDNAHGLPIQSDRFIVALNGAHVCKLRDSDPGGSDFLPRTIRK